MQSFVRQLPERFGALGTVIYDGRRNQLRVMDSPMGRVVVKHFRKPGPVNRLAYTFVRTGKARRSFEYSRRLLDIGVDVPAPLAFVETYRGGLLADSYYVSECFPTDMELRAFARYDGADADAIMCMTAQILCRLYQADMFYRDFTPGNVLIHNTTMPVRVALVDVNRMSFGPIAYRKEVYQLTRLYISDANLTMLVRHYARLRGLDEERFLADVMARVKRD